MKRQGKINGILTGLLIFLLVAIFVGSCSDSGNAESTAAPVAAAESEKTPVPVADTGSLPTFDEYPRPKMSVDGKKLVVAYLYGTLDQEDDNRLYHQINIEGYNRGWEIRYIQVGMDEQRIRTGWLTANNFGVDVIIIPGMDSLANKQDLIEASRNLGIGLYACDSTATKGVITNFNLANGVCALELFYKVASDLNFEGDFCITTGYTFAMVWERTLPVNAYLQNDAIFPNLRLLDEQSVDFSSALSLQEQVYNFMQTWNQKYGKDIDAVFVGADADALVANESAVAAGRTIDDLKIFTIGGSPGVVANMRQGNTCIAYNYAQSPEFQIHSICELAAQIQIQGLTPGDGKCMADVSGGNTTLAGAIITRSTTPAAGESVHTIFDYYDEDDKDAWYFWTSPDFPEVYKWQ
ncbi:hypothetical protein LQZ21_11470 [Treponema sp. TIM-1]|uniref:sugar ABC transporter substrate-binding protein n=1 Tax=Treponema sp. TIM-1 TaxID=2898417 RepID=UPI0039806DF7